MQRPEPFFLVDLLPDIHRELIQFLKSLSPSDWDRQTLAPAWKIKDVTAHLLDGNLRTLSMLRDRYYGESPGAIDSHSDLVAYLNRLNADWVTAMKRLSPSVMVSLLEDTGKEYCAFLKTLAPFEKAEFSVGWAGEQESQNWFHIAREYTEKWHHQQQIRFAVDPTDQTLLRTHWMRPYLQTSVRALPHHYRSLRGEKGDVVKFVFWGEEEHVYYLKWEENEWVPLTSTLEMPTSEVRIANDYAWRIFTKGIGKKEAMDKSEVIGKRELGSWVFDMIAIMG